MSLLMGSKAFQNILRVLNTNICSTTQNSLFGMNYMRGFAQKATGSSGNAGNTNKSLAGGRRRHRANLARDVNGADPHVLVNWARSLSDILK